MSFGTKLKLNFILGILFLLVNQNATVATKINSVKNDNRKNDNVENNNAKSNTEEVIIDSDMTFEEAIFGSNAPQNILAEQVLLNVEYYSFDNKLHRGQVVVNKAVADDIVEIFEIIKQTKFPLAKVIPIVKYGWSDSASMADNNTSAFNYRVVAGTKKLSNHAFGKAIDFNPMQNPYRSKSGRLSPKGSSYNPKVAGTLTQDNVIVKKMIEKGWTWGGNFKTIKDWHHFDKK